MSIYALFIIIYHVTKHVVISRRQQQQSLTWVTTDRTFFNFLGGRRPKPADEYGTRAQVLSHHRDATYND